MLLLTPRPRLLLTRFLTLATATLSLCAFASSPASAQTPQPGGPGNFAVRALDHEVALSWIVPWQAPATGYNIYRGTTPCGESSTPLNGSTPIPATDATMSYTDTSVTNGQTYYYEVSYVNDDGESARTASGELAATPDPVVATPVISPATGNYYAVQAVTITDSTTGAEIHYTIDGSTPDDTSKVYSGSFSITGNTTVQAVASASGYADSDLATSVITLPNAPTVILVNPTGFSFY